MLDLAAHWLRSIPAVRELALRASYLRFEMDRYPLAEVAAALDELAGRAEQADPVAREVLASAVTILTDPEGGERADALRRVAGEAALLPLGRLLRKRLKSEPTADAPPIDERLLATSSTGRILTLGERKALARRPTRAALDKLLRDPHPAVIRNLLANPRLTEDDVVRLAARRPAFRDVIGEIARHPAWSRRARVRMALVQNPGTPPEISVPMVQLLIRPELDQVIQAVDVPALVRAAARELLDRRPPVPERAPEGDPQ